MTGLWLSILLGLSVLLALPRSRTPVRPAVGAGPSSGGRERARGVRTRGGALAMFRPHLSRPAPGLQDVPLLIHQLTGLLAAGRAPHQLWADAAALHSGNSREAGGPLAVLLLPVLEAAAQAASLGLSPVPVFQAAAQDNTGSSPRIRRKGSGGAVPGPLAGLWGELAACVSVSERSGAPLAGVLGRYAGQIESGLDSQAARETALAGPQATVRLLTWLPAGGLGLGYVLGADPVGVLLGSPLGWLAGLAGAALSLIGRFWSRALVRQAAGL